ncbi:MAG TPA: cation transporter [Caulobacteraceae bacterium]
MRRGLRLEYATLAWNVVGAPLMLFTAVKADSTALAGFGLDSLVEIFASVVVVWQLKGVADDRERRALRLIGAAFFLLAAYVLCQSVWTLATRSHPAPSPLGMVWLVTTVATMALLAYGKLLTGRALGNVVLRAEARVTLIDAALAAAVLTGVGLNALTGLWWADPLAGLVIVYYGVKEGQAAFAHAREGA